MSNDKIKVAGYAQKITYTNGIEWRPFSPDLVGFQLTSDGGSSLFTIGNFKVTTNTTDRVIKNFKTRSFSNFINLDSLNTTLADGLQQLQNKYGVILNLDNRNLNNHALFNSMTEFVRVCLENIIMTWPASLYVNANYTTLPLYETFSGLTYESYTYDQTNDKSYLKINTNTINNKFGINYLTSGTLENTFNKDNDLRNLSVNYINYVLDINNKEYKIIAFTGSTSEKNDYIYISLSGNPFSSTTGYDSFHIRPNTINVNLFFNKLDNFSEYLLNRKTNPKYTAQFNYSIKSDSGALLYLKESLTWPTTDGYNIDYDTDEYVDYADKLLKISENQDLSSSNLMIRFLVSDSITDFDTSPVHLSDLDQDTSDKKINKTLTIYGVEFDEINKYINGIKLANTVTYDKQDNIPDIYIKDLARILGWDVLSPVVENDIIQQYLTTTTASYSGESVGLTPIQADVELWRRLVLNTPWIWKSKGTRKGVEFLFKFIGVPDGLIKFNEHVYLAENKINIDEFLNILELNGLDTDLSNYPISLSGYPKPFTNTSDLYFQSDGLWYRETGGVNATTDTTSGNNPHVGSYDGGNKYLNQFKNLIPDFKPVTLSSETTTTTTTNLFTNYNSGKMNEYSGSTYVDLITDDGVDFSECYVVTPTIILDPKKRQDETNCGCETDDQLKSLSICLDKTNYVGNPCIQDIASYQIVSPYGYYMFNFKQYNQDGTQFTINGQPVYNTSMFVNKTCCNFNGSIPYFYNQFENGELINNGYICCSAINNCGCLSTCKWKLSSEITIQLQGETYLVFNDDTNTKRLTSEDGCNCIKDYTIPVSISDPYLNTTGYACQLTNLGKADINSNLSVIKTTYEKRNTGEINCMAVYQPQNTRNVYLTILNDTDNVGNKTVDISYQVLSFGQAVGTHVFNSSNYPLSGSPVGYMAKAIDNLPLLQNGNMISLIVNKDTQLPSNLQFNPSLGHRLSYTFDDLNLSSVDFSNKLSSLSSGLITDNGSNYSISVPYSFTNSNIYLVADYRKQVITQTNNYKIKYTNNISSQNVILLVGNNGITPNKTVYDGNYISDPIIGYSANLPATNAKISLIVNGKKIISATCNGVTITPNTNIAEWTNVNGFVDITFTTEVNNGTSYRMPFTQLSIMPQDICSAQNRVVFINQDDMDKLNASNGILQPDMVLYSDNALTTRVTGFNYVRFNYQTNTLNQMTGAVGNIYNIQC